MEDTMKKSSLILCLVLAAALLTGCTGNKPDPLDTKLPAVLTQAPAMDNPTSAPLPEGLDPSAEEDVNPQYVDELSSTADSAMVSQYAGATPILLDPIDMPTPTPQPPMVFTYQTYTATNLGLSFESVAGYDVDQSQPDSFILTEPASQQKDNYSVQISLIMTTVPGTYKAADIRADLDAPGYYANYRGVRTDGTIIRGRVHMALMPNNRLLTLHVTNPAAYNTDYISVFTQIRNTLKAL
jgi:hypothetical protein